MEHTVIFHTPISVHIIIQNGILNITHGNALRSYIHNFALLERTCRVDTPPRARRSQEDFTTLPFFLLGRKDKRKTEKSPENESKHISCDV
jgi:hypothetical protein